jgi:signal transduction histidine kinase
VRSRVRDLLLPRTPLRLPRRTVRLRLTVLYATLFLACGGALLAITYVLVRHATGHVLVGTNPNGSRFAIIDTKKAGAGHQVTTTTTPKTPTPSTGERHPPAGVTGQQTRAQAQHDRALAERQRSAELHQLLEQSGIALGLMAVVSVLVGWVAAGRVLRPLRTITERARDISASNLHERLALTGPDDELTQLSGTFDDLLGRLEAAFVAGRQFVANASHELRTPLARARTLSEVALADDDATVSSLRTSHERVIAAGEQQERVIAALLALARSQRGLDHRKRVDLASVTAAAVAARRADAEERGLRLEVALEQAITSGDARLVERLVTNLLSNALAYNILSGWVAVATATRGDRALITVTNTGPAIPRDEIPRLLRPFERLDGERTATNGVGLGLSIVHAIAQAHSARLTARARPAGGLEIEVAFPKAS